MVTYEKKIEMAGWICNMLFHVILLVLFLRVFLTCHENFADYNNPVYPPDSFPGQTIIKLR